MTTRYLSPNVYREAKNSKISELDPRTWAEAFGGIFTSRGIRINNMKKLDKFLDTIFELNVQIRELNETKPKK